MARQKKNKGKATRKGYRPIEEAGLHPGASFPYVARSTQDPNKPLKDMAELSEIRPYKTKAYGHGVSKGRRILSPYGFQDPDEARAVSEDVFPGTILERIMYKRNLILYGTPGPSTWDTQVQTIPHYNMDLGERVDFLYYVNFPYCIIEPQGIHWHEPWDRWGDNARGFLLQSRGYRYYELWEDDILRNDDEWLDNQITFLVGQTTQMWPETKMLLPWGTTQPLPQHMAETFKESQRKRYGLY